MNSNYFTILFLVLITNIQISAQDWNQLGVAIASEDAAVVDIDSDGNTIIIGAPVDGNNIGNDGTVMVYDRSGSSWTQRGNTFNGENSGDNLGASVSISADGNTIAMGAPRNSDTEVDGGMTKVYNWNGSEWNKLGSSIYGVGFNDQSGNAVSLSADGTILAVAASNNSDNDIQSGHVRIFEWDGTDWNQMGASIVGANGGDRCGFSVSLSEDGNTIAMGEITNDDGGNNAGQVRIFSFDGTDWNQKGADIEGTEESGRMGWSISLSGDGNTVATGAPRNFDDNKGFVKVYQYNGSTWESKGGAFTGTNDDAQLGNSVSLTNDGNVLAIGSPGYEVNNSNKGLVQSFSWSNNSWLQRGDDFTGGPNGSGLGHSVALTPSGSALAILSIGLDEVDVFQWGMQTAVNDVVMATDILVAPNPTLGNIKITTEESYMKKVEVINMLGAVITVHDNVNAKEISLNLEGSTGFYFVKTEKENGEIAVEKIMKL